MSGLLLVVLVLGHLLIMNILDGGVQRSASLRRRPLGLAVLAHLGPAMLWLAELHGTNGLRTIINDYAERDGTRFWLKMLLYTSALVLPRHAGDLHLRPEHHLRGPIMQLHRYDTVIVGAGGAGMRAALAHSAAKGAANGRAHQALPDALPHRRGAGRHVRRAGERRGGQLGVAHLRHDQGR